MVIDEYRSSASCTLEIEMTNLKNTAIYPWLKLKKETTDLDGIGRDKPEMRINLLTRVQETLKVRNDLRGLYKVWVKGHALQESKCAVHASDGELSTLGEFHSSSFVTFKASISCKIQLHSP